VAAVDDSSAPRQLTDDPSLDSWWPRISPDRRTILFYRAPAGVHDLDATKVSLWAMDADGSNRWSFARPVWTDGRCKATPSGNPTERRS
jgi:Tol biopolymer transport system component